jgi:hypothetical protein
VNDCDIASKLGISEVSSLREDVFGGVTSMGFIFQKGEVLGDGPGVSFDSKFGHTDPVGNKASWCMDTQELSSRRGC